MEQIQEEVQLTELLPVKRSRIKHNGDGDDGNVADAFVALRDGNKNDFTTEIYDFVRKADGTGERTDDGYVRDVHPSANDTVREYDCSKRTDFNQRITTLRKRPATSRDTGGNEKGRKVSKGDALLKANNKINQRKKNCNASSSRSNHTIGDDDTTVANGGNNGRPRERISDQRTNVSDAQAEPSKKKRKNSRKSYRREEKNVSPNENCVSGGNHRSMTIDNNYYQQCAGPTHVAPEKDNGVVHGNSGCPVEMYVSRRENHTDISSGNLNNKSNNDSYGNNADGIENVGNVRDGNNVCDNLNDAHPEGDHPERPGNDSADTRNERVVTNERYADDVRTTNNVGSREPIEPTEDEEVLEENVEFHRHAKTDHAEENLRRKIDAIIQANFMIERENNNTMQRNNNKLQDTNDAAKPTNNVDPDFLLKKYCCVVCSARFKGSGGLRTHYRVVHETGPVFTCDECGKEFPLKERLKLHVRTHTGYKPYKCSECGKTFARGGQLVQHRRTHTRIKPYQCDMCPGQFSCAANLALHVKRHNGQKDHKCDICGRAFVRRDALKKHLDCLHKDVKSFLCVICNKTFKGHLPQHMRTHAQDRPHGCGTCGQRFAQKSQLTVHQRTHSGQRPFRCLVCWQAFAHSTALKLHTRRHTGERPFKCAECNAGFTQLPHWKKHMRCVHGRIDPYCCTNCNTFFRIKNDLENHEKTCRLADPMIVIDTDHVVEKATLPKYRVMNVEKMRLLLAVLLKRISKPERLDELGFGKRLIDEVLKDSLVSAGKDLAKSDGLSEFEVLRSNLATFLEWTVPKEHWDVFRKSNKTPEEILETLTAT